MLYFKLMNQFFIKESQITLLNELYNLLYTPQYLASNIASFYMHYLPTKLKIYLNIQ